MLRKPRIAIVGAGNLGTALAIALKRAGFPISGIIGRRSSVRNARSLAKQVGCRASTNPTEIDADLIWFCVPDGEIARAARLWANPGGRPRFAFHSSGALSSDELEALRRKGLAIASVHPLMTFVPGSCPALAGVPFAVEGDAAAVRLARQIIDALDGHCYAIRKQDKAAYHAWATFASPLLTALLATTEQVAALAGVKGGEIRRRMIPILLQTLANYAQYGAAGAFSGPIIRGDVETVRKHLRVLRKIPEARDVYLALARAAQRYLPVKNKQTLKFALHSRSL
jgi:predicted short-subunit dehydrogenase-like oxidoreductase (DUF2520 family)